MFNNHRFSQFNVGLLFWTATIISLCVLSGCSSKKKEAALNPVTEPKLTAVVTDLKVVTTEPDRITVSWKTPATGGEELYYEVRYSKNPITAEHWYFALACPLNPPVGDSGSVQLFDVTGLEAGTPSYIAVRIHNAAGVWGPVSENISGTIPSLLAKPVSFSFYGNSLATADFDNDGDTDIVITNGSTTDDNVHILANDGLGGFTKSHSLAVNGTASLARTADFNNDGFIDMAVLTTTRVFVLINDGAGLFSEAGNRYIGQMGTHLEAADFNGDGFADFIASSSYYGGKYTGSSFLLAVYFNDGNCTFDEMDTVTSYYGVNGMCLFDPDHDGDLDVVFSRSGYNFVTILYNNGIGLYLGNSKAVDMGNPTRCIFPDDVHNDGEPDLIGACDYQLMVAAANDQGEYILNVFTPGVWGEEHIHSGDFDDDGFSDIVRACGDCLSLHINKGPGNFSGAARYPLGNEGLTYGLDVVDFDADGHPDVALIYGGKLTILMSSL